ncbi:hypothetical protein J5H50_24530, partial [Enterobacter sichuanensis]|nr:hypothetical protein [Enterobacter sichuanensis]
VIVCAEMDEQWGYVGAKSRQRWLFWVTSALNHASAGCFTRMTGYGGRLWRTYSVNARWPVVWMTGACCRPLRSWYG